MNINKKLLICTTPLLLALGSQTVLAETLFVNVSGTTELKADGGVEGFGTITDRTTDLTSGEYTDFQNSSIENGVYKLKYQFNQSAILPDFGITGNVLIGANIYYDKASQSGYLTSLNCASTDGANGNFICGFVNSNNGVQREISGSLSEATSSLGTINFSDDLNFSVKVADIAGSFLTLNFELTPQTSEVPVPAAAWLFGTALAGLVGFKRKK